MLGAVDTVAQANNHDEIHGKHHRHQATDGDRDLEHGGGGTSEGVHPNG
jgi:hypothetical protein